MRLNLEEALTAILLFLCYMPLLPLIMAPPVLLVWAIWDRVSGWIDRNKYHDK